MAKIKQLSAQEAQKIAAGEVVERNTMMKRAIILLLSIGFASAMEKEILPFNVIEWQSAHFSHSITPTTFDNLNYGKFHKNFDQLIKNKNFMKLVPELIEEGEGYQIDKSAIFYLTLPITIGIPVCASLITGAPHPTLVVGAALLPVSIGCMCACQRTVQKKLKLLKKAQAILNQQNNE